MLLAQPACQPGRAARYPRGRAGRALEEQNQQLRRSLVGAAAAPAAGHDAGAPQWQPAAVGRSSWRGIDAGGFTPRLGGPAGNVALSTALATPGAGAHGLAQPAPGGLDRGRPSPAQQWPAGDLTSRLADVKRALGAVPGAYTDADLERHVDRLLDAQGARSGVPLVGFPGSEYGGAQRWLR